MNVYFSQSEVFVQDRDVFCFLELCSDELFVTRGLLSTTEHGTDVVMNVQSLVFVPLL